MKVNRLMNLETRKLLNECVNAEPKLTDKLVAYIQMIGIIDYRITFLTENSKTQMQP